MTIAFSASNQRSTDVWLALQGSPGAIGSGQLKSGDTRQIQGRAGGIWVAHSSPALALDSLIGVYEPTDRVPTWRILEVKTGLPSNLERFNNGPYSESLVTPAEFLRPDRILKAIFLFVDFSDAPAAGAPWSNQAEIIQRISGGADSWLKEVSFGRSGLVVAHQAGWRRMPKAATEYSNDLCRCLSGSSRAYIEDVAALFATDVDFSLYDFVCVVAAKTDALALSPAWSGLAPNGSIPTSSGPISHAITFGADSYHPATDERLLLHEALHLCGLPDLYDGGSVDRNGVTGGYSPRMVAPWDLMADHRESRHLLGWHRLKLGWLDLSQVCAHFGGGTLEIEITNWTQAEGIHSVMVPVRPSPLLTGCRDDYRQSSSQAYLVEVAPGGVGVLVYSVDASVPTWERPVLVRAGCDAFQPGPLQSGEIFRHLTAGLEVKVLAPTPAGYRIAVSSG